MIIELHFDYAEYGDNVVLACVAQAEKSRSKQLFRKVVTVPKQGNNFHHTMMAMLLAFEEVRSWDTKSNDENADNEITLHNQNSRIFEWLRQREAPEAYDDILTDIIDVIADIADRFKFGFNIIQGKDNRAKKIIKNELDRDRPKRRELDFKDLKEAHKNNKVVELRRSIF